MTPDLDIEHLLDRFPKTRPAMSPAAAAVHEAILKGNRERDSLLSKISDWLESWMHRQIALSRGATSGQEILEIGAGTLNHLDYEPSYASYDIIEPFGALFERRPELKRVRVVYADMAEISRHAIYDRIVSVATLEHLTRLPEAVARAGLLLRSNGLFQASIPSEGGFLWGLSWRATFAITYKLTTGRNWSEHMRYEHVNDAYEIGAIINYFFEDVTIRRFPLPIHHLSLYESIDARRPRLDRCVNYLDSLA